MNIPEEQDPYASVADLYDWIVPYRTRKDIAFFVSAAAESKGPVLEIGSGTGRVLIPIARADIEIVGLDLSPSMLEICRRRMEQESMEVRSRIRIVQKDMRSFDLGQKFPLVMAPFRSFQHLLTPKDQIDCLTCIHRHLADDGRLILDLFNPSLESLVSDDLGQEIGEEPEFIVPDGRRVIRRHRIVSRDLASQVNEIELVHYVTFPDGRQERLAQGFLLRYLFRYEAEHLLVRCGFRVEKVFADYDGSPYGSKYPGELILVARKSEG